MKIGILLIAITGTYIGFVIGYVSRPTCSNSQYEQALQIIKIKDEQSWALLNMMMAGIRKDLARYEREEIKWRQSTEREDSVWSELSTIATPIKVNKK